MLRRSLAVIIAGSTVLATPACGIKGPLRLPPGESAPAPTGMPPGAIPATTLSDRPAYTTPAPAPLSPAPGEDKDKQE